MKQSKMHVNIHQETHLARQNVIHFLPHSGPKLCLPPIVTGPLVHVPTHQLSVAVWDNISRDSTARPQLGEQIEIKGYCGPRTRVYCVMSKTTYTRPWHLTPELLAR